jgi:Protein of unknown function (DUF3040)
MSLPAGQQRALERIEQTLAAEESRLGSLFAVFTRLTRNEALPRTEQITGRPWRLRWPAAVIPLTLLTLVVMLVATWRIPSGHACPTIAVGTGHTLPVSTTARCQPSRVTWAARYYPG